MTTVEPRNLRPLTATLVARYAERFNAAFADGEHAVTSPLGAWLLLALVAPAAEGDARSRLEAVALADGRALSVPRDAFRWHGVPVFSAWVAEPAEATD